VMLLFLRIDFSILCSLRCAFFFPKSDPMTQHYKLYFLRDFSDLLLDISPNHYGMIEQLVIARGDLFVGTFYSTFSAYVNRIRGYHAQKNRAPGSEQGILNSEYLGHNGKHRDEMKVYKAVHNNVWTREWPSAWRNIDLDVSASSTTK